MLASLKKYIVSGASNTSVIGASFDISAQIPTGTTTEDRRWALSQALEAVERGATHVILGMPPRLGPAGVDAVAREVAQPFRDTIG